MADKMAAQFLEMTLPLDRKSLQEEMQSLYEEVGYALHDLADERHGGTTWRLGNIQQRVGQLIERNAKIRALTEAAKLLAKPETP